MGKRIRDNERHYGGGGVLAALCNVLGTMLIVIVIALVAPLAVPHFFGYEIYEIVSGSMEPDIPVGSVVYSKHIDCDDIDVGDIVAFERNGVIVVHRVTMNRVSSGELVTKGDANSKEDPAPVPYSKVRGRVELSIPNVGSFMTLYSSFAGKICLLLIAVCGVMLNVLAGRMRSARRAYEDVLIYEILNGSQGRSLQEWIDGSYAIEKRRRLRSRRIRTLVITVILIVVLGFGCVIAFTMWQNSTDDTLYRGAPASFTSASDKVN